MQMFDEAGRPATETGSGATGSRSFSYDVAGRVTSISHPATPITVTYDDTGRPLTVGGGGGTTTYSWDNDGRLTQRSGPAGTSTMTWDNASRLASETDPLTGGCAVYGYDDAGRRTSVHQYTALSGGTVSSTRWTGHDEYGRASWDVLVPAGSGGTETLGRSYSYDNDNNQTAVNVWGISSPADAGFQWGTYNSRGELSSWTDTTSTTTNFTYDKNGNRTAAGAVTYVYDGQNRLVSGGGATYVWADRGTLSSVTKAGTTTASTFDVFGQNLTDGAVTQTYDGLGRIATRNSVGFTYTGTSLDPTGDGTWTVNHSMLAGEVLSVKTGSTARWGVSDTHRNLVALNVPSSGAVDNTTRYTPFGETAARTGTLNPTVGFQGDYTDPTTSNVWMGARHYTPSTATFTSRDSYSGRLEQPISLNRYTYAHNNPLNLWDRDGHDPSRPRDIFIRNLDRLMDLDTMNHALWYHTIAKNNGSLGEWDRWWAAYYSLVLSPQHAVLRQAAIAGWDSEHESLPKPATARQAPKRVGQPSLSSASSYVVETLQIISKRAGTDSITFLKDLARIAATVGVDFRHLFGIYMTEMEGSPRTWVAQPCERHSVDWPCDTYGPSNLSIDKINKALQEHPHLAEVEWPGTNPCQPLPLTIANIPGAVAIAPACYHGKAGELGLKMWGSTELSLTITAIALKQSEAIAQTLLVEGNVAPKFAVRELALGAYVGSDPDNQAFNALPHGDNDGTIRKSGSLSGRPKRYQDSVLRYSKIAEIIYCKNGTNYRCSNL